jgi:catechol-2,3-dioxygenase
MSWRRASTPRAPEASFWRFPNNSQSTYVAHGRGESRTSLPTRRSVRRGAISRHLAAHGAACGAQASRYGAEGLGLSVYLTDAEGNGVEFKGPVGD